MSSSLSFGAAPLNSHARLSISSSPQPSLSSSDGSMRTPTFDPSVSQDRSVSDEIVPKIEELDVDLGDVKVAPFDENPPVSPTQVEKKRPRGRPRKHPLVSPSAITKATNSRCKTGCQTCRKRKKKCDEGKPTCFQCQKNNVVCEGYAPKERWKSGKERDAEVAKRRKFDVPIELPILIEGVENDQDRRLLNHFIENASRVLSLYGEKRNPFTTVILPLAYVHRGLMHSILCLSSSHLSSLEPDGGYQERQIYHFDWASKILRSELGRPQHIGEAGPLYEDPTVVQAQILMLFLRTIADGNTTGEYRVHLDAVERLIRTQPSPNPEFQSLVFEFWRYHAVLNSVTSLDRRTTGMMEDFKLPSMLQPEAGALIGVMDGLFGFMSKINNLRHRVRYRIENNLLPHVDFDGLADMQAIDAGLREWECPLPQGTPRYIASLLYKQCVWLYLYRTTKPSRPDANIRKAVDDGLAYFRELPQDGPTQSILLMPVFLLGCAAFEDYQRPEVTRAFDALMGYSGLKNIRCAKIVVDKVWEMMDAGNEESWDWEKIIEDLGWDFLIT